VSVVWRFECVFFASRRRHTRLVSDWSSDVWSSDLGALLALAYPDRIGRRRAGTAGRYLLSGGRGAVLPEGDPLGNEEFLVVADRSEERRVGKECGCRWVEVHDKRYVGVRGGERRED